MMITVDAPNHYEVLGVAKDATPDEIRAAHRRLVHQVHTDKGGTDALPPGASCV
jgi:curved DNA-binding protein CbpA